MNEINEENPVNVLMVTPQANQFIELRGKQLLERDNIVIDKPDYLRGAIEKIEQSAKNGKEYDIVVVFAGRDDNTRVLLYDDKEITEIFEKTPNAMKVVAYHLDTDGMITKKYKDEKQVPLVMNELAIVGTQSGMRLIHSYFNDIHKKQIDEKLSTFNSKSRQDYLLEQNKGEKPVITRQDMRITAKLM